MDIQMHHPGIVTRRQGYRSLCRTSSSGPLCASLAVCHAGVPLSGMVSRHAAMVLAQAKRGVDRSATIDRSSRLRNFFFSQRCGFEFGLRSRFQGEVKKTPNAKFNDIRGLKP